MLKNKHRKPQLAYLSSKPWVSGFAAFQLEGNKNGEFCLKYTSLM